MSRILCGLLVIYQVFENKNPQIYDVLYSVFHSVLGILKQGKVGLYRSKHKVYSLWTN